MTPPGGPPPSADFLRSLIAQEGGSISIERFMQEALYHPELGYYARRVRAVGRDGDFSTSATLHPALGQAIAAWARSHRAEIVHRGAWHLIELGGGSGQLAAEILRAVPWWPKRGLRYHLVEISAGLRAAQRQRLSKAGRNVRWHEGMRSALQAARGRALIFSNEFVDAFPCVQLERGTQAGSWREVRVCWPEGATDPGETLADWPGPLPGFGPDDEPAVGQRVELHRSYLRWLEEAAAGWEAGRWLTIDYGDVLPGLYHRRPQGTLRAYCRHQRLTELEVYRRFGQQDLTADVNFADLQRWGSSLGWATESLSTQADFLRRWLPLRRLGQAGLDPALAFLLDPAGAGGAFKVLEQKRLRAEDSRNISPANQNAA